MILPQLCQSVELTSLDAVINNPNLGVQQKIDGKRLLMLVHPDAPPVPLTRNGSVHTQRLPKALQDFRLPEGPWLIDGELMPDGIFWAFDMPQLPSYPNFHERQLEHRYLGLATLLHNMFGGAAGAATAPIRLIPMARTRDEKVALAQEALSRNLEGLVIKKLDSRYSSGGRNTDWLKLKFVSTADVVVKRLRADGKESMEYIVFDEAGDEVEIGKASLIGKEKRGAFQVDDVVEVKYLYVGADGRLVQPTIVSKRTDKLPHECTTGQLRHVNKEVLASL